VGDVVEAARAGREAGLRETVRVLQDRLETAAPPVVAQVAGQLRLTLGELHAEGWLDVTSYRVSLTSVRDFVALAIEKIDDSDDAKVSVESVIAQLTGQLRAVLRVLGNLPVEDHESPREKLRLVVGGNVG
jgi:hypothetical protein